MGNMITCEMCGNLVDMDDKRSDGKVECEGCGSEFKTVDTCELPKNAMICDYILKTTLNANASIFNAHP